MRGVSFVGGGKNAGPPARLRGSSWGGAVHEADWYSLFAHLAGAGDPSAGTGPLPADGVDGAALWAALASNASSPRTEVPIQIESTAPANAYDAPPRALCDDLRARGAEARFHCVPPVAAPGATPGDGDARAAKAGLKCGVLIQGKWKLIWGYPGWRQGWDGWITPPDAASLAGAALGDDGPYAGTLCAKHPCLFDIETDPFEKHDVGGVAANTATVKAMKARVLELLASEVTVAASGLCPTPLGSKPDPRGTAVAVATGFWQPWLKDPVQAE